MRDFRAALGEFAWEVIRESRVAEKGSLSYKIKENAFADFRQTFERKFLDTMLARLQQPLAEHLNEQGEDAFRPRRSASPPTHGSTPRSAPYGATRSTRTSTAKAG